MTNINDKYKRVIDREIDNDITKKAQVLMWIAMRIPAIDTIFESVVDFEI